MIRIEDDRSTRWKMATTGRRRKAANPARGGTRILALSDPREIGRYRVVRRLGQGGFGRVYLAQDDDLDRPVAIKVPNPERVSGPGDVEAYLAEARALAKLDHPNIVPVYDVGRTERRSLLRGLEVHRGQRPGRARAAGPADLSGVGRAGRRWSPVRCTTLIRGAWSTATSSPPIS